MKNEKGFTLLEVLIALGILAISLGVLSFRQQAILQSLTESERLTTATMLARKKIVETEIEFRGLSFTEMKASEEGDFEEYEGFTWVRTVNDFELTIPVETDENAAGESLSTEMMVGKLSEILSEHVREVRLKVLYTVMGKPREVEVVTHIVDLMKDLNISL